MLEKGTAAPDFTLPDDNGNDITLSGFLGKKVVLYFYSKDNTAGCTAQAKGFAELNGEFNEKNAVVIGVSKDTQASHAKFREKFSLPFILLSDVDLDVIRLYDVWKEKTMYGKKTMGVLRTTYLIDENGIISEAFDKVKAADNPRQMLDLL